MKAILAATYFETEGRDEALGTEYLIGTYTPVFRCNLAPGEIKAALPRRRHYVVAIAGIAALVVLILSAGPLLGATTYDLKADWSDAANPNGVWAYKVGESVLPAVADWVPATAPGAQPAWAFAPSGRGHIPVWFRSKDRWAEIEPGDIVGHTDDPANGTGRGEANVTWTAPAAGTVDISVAVWYGGNPNRSGVWMLQYNAATLSSGTLAQGSPYTRSRPAIYLRSGLAVRQGDVLRLLWVRSSGSGPMLGVDWRVTLDSDARPATETRNLTLSFTDPPADQTGRIDITNMTMSFDSSNGNYEIVLTADPNRPFAGQFRVDINLYNPDAPAAASLFSVASGDYTLTAPAGSLVVRGVSSVLRLWDVGHRVAASSVPFGSPAGSRGFRSSVFDLPQASTCAFDPVNNGCNEDVLAWGASTTIAPARTPPAVTALSSASYLAGAAPDSLVSLFGTQLALRSVSGSPTAAGQWSLAVADVTVEINGRAAGLAYVSPTQINCVVPHDTEMGPARIVVKNAGNEVAVGTMNVTLAAPALFSTDGAGRGNAVAFNAVTYATAPFSVVTPQNAGADKRTRLAVLGTGIRWTGNSARNAAVTNAAANVRARATTPAGGAVPLGLEYAGPAPGFPGVDQVNLVLPAEADTAERLNITIDAGGLSSNTLAIPIRQAPPPVISLEAAPDEPFSASGMASTFTDGQGRKTYAVKNTGTTTQTYTARSSVAWLTLTPRSGSLAANATANVAVHLNTAANSLAAGSYAGAITFASGSVSLTRTATLTVTPIGDCLNIGGQWSFSESGSGTLTITALGETDRDTLRISGQGITTIFQEGCSIRYSPVPVSSLITAQQAQSLQRTGTVSGAGISVSGQAVVTVPVPGLNITKIDENRYQATGRSSGGVVTLDGTGTFRASGTFNLEGQSGTFSMTLTLSSTATGRRTGTSATGAAAIPSGDPGSVFRHIFERIRHRAIR